MKNVSSPILPEARKEGILIQELADELLIYDIARHNAHCLNQTAMIIWEHCDGRTSLAQLIRVLEESNAPADEEAIWMAVSQLRKRHLLADSAALPKGRSNLSRREAIRKIGIAAAIGLPLVTTIIAPSAMAAGSCDCPPGPLPVCCPAGCPCMTGARCCSGVCRSGSCT